MKLATSFTSTGEKLFHHQEAMQALRDGKGLPIHAWLAPHDLCNHKCSFCSVGERAGDALAFPVIEKYFRTLVGLGLKAVTISGGGNPLLYRCKETGKTIDDLISFLFGLGLQVGMITNGMPMRDYEADPDFRGTITTRWTSGSETKTRTRRSWKTLRPETLDKLTWCRISMSGIDHNHKEQEVFVPDFDPEITSLGFSWIMSDSYEEPSHKHGWVSTPEDIRTEIADRKVVWAIDRLPFVESKIREYVERHNPRYVRLLSNCLQPDLIPERHRILSEMADRIDPSRVFSQHKPPRQPKKCFKVLPHPCLNSDGWVYPCDSVVLNRDAGHKFGSKWRICRADEIAELYANPSKFQMPDGICAGCVFADQVDLIYSIANGAETPVPEGPEPAHVNFV